MLAYRPDEAYMLMAVKDRADLAAYDRIACDLARIGCAFHIVNDVRPWSYDNYGTIPKARVYAALNTICKRHGGTFLEFEDRLKQLPGWRKLRPFTGDVHMYTPGHVFFARELLRWMGRCT